MISSFCFGQIGPNDPVQDQLVKIPLVFYLLENGLVYSFCVYRANAHAGVCFACALFDPFR